MIGGDIFLARRLEKIKWKDDACYNLFSGHLLLYWNQSYIYRTKVKNLTPWKKYMCVCCSLLNCSISMVSDIGISYSINCVMIDVINWIIGKKSSNCLKHKAWLKYKAYQMWHILQT